MAMLDPSPETQRLIRNGDRIGAIGTRLVQFTTPGIFLGLALIVVGSAGASPPLRYTGLALSLITMLINSIAMGCHWYGIRQYKRASQLMHDYYRSRHDDHE